MRYKVQFLNVKNVSLIFVLNAETLAEKYNFFLQAQLIQKLYTFTLSKYQKTYVLLNILIFLLC